MSPLCGLMERAVVMIDYSPGCMRDVSHERREDSFSESPRLIPLRQYLRALLRGEVRMVALRELEASALEGGADWIHIR